MFNPRWRKIFRDIRQNLGRVSLVVGAIGLGIFSVTWVSSAYGILSRELNDNYLAINPASAVLYIEESSPDIVEAIQARPDIANAEASGMIQGRIRVDDEWLRFELFTRQNLDATRINQLAPEDGAFPPLRGEILIERAALPVADVDIGDSVLIQIGERQYTVPVAGTLHDMSLPPAWQENMVYGYATPETLEELGIPIALDELRITVADKVDDKVYIRDVAFDTRNWLEAQGYEVFRVEVPPPLEHPSQSQMESLMLLLGGFAVLVFVLSAALVTNMMSAFLAGQTRQIAVMKAVGARQGQIVRLYLGMVLMLCALAALAWSIGILAGNATAAFVAFILNFDIESYAIPHPAFLLQIVIGVGVPVLAAAYPIYMATHTTVRAALNDYRVSQNAFGESWFDRQLSRVRGIRLPMLLALRNTFRKRGRLILTFSTLAIGGALFMAALNVRASLLNSIDTKYERLHYDVVLTFEDPYPVDELETAARQTEGVTNAEAWGRSSAAIIEADGTAGNSFVLLAPPADTSLVDLEVIEGNWLSDQRVNGIVLNHALLAEYPGLQVGDEITLTMSEHMQSWRIIGFVREPASPPSAYVAYSDFPGPAGFAQSLFVVTQQHDEASLIAAKRNLEEAFFASDIPISANLNSYDSRKIVEDHAVLITSFLVMAAAMSLMVGGLGLMTTMGINVLERTREIGVMRAIGASNSALLKIILGEGMVIALLSWLLAAVIVVPMSYQVAQMLGQTMLETRLDFALDPFGFLIWLAVVLVFSIVASWLPARNAARITVHNVLSYE